MRKSLPGPLGPAGKIRRLASFAAHTAIQKSPPAIRALFRHTDEYRARRMARLYDKGVAANPASGTTLFWVPGGMPLLLHVEAAIGAALRLRGHKVHAIICNSPYRGCAVRTVDEGRPINRWREVCSACVRKTSSVLETIGIPFSYNGDYVSEELREELWTRSESVTWENLDDLTYEDVQIGRNVRSSIVRYLQGAALTGHEAIVREYAFSGLVSAASIKNALAAHRPARVVMSHGTYIDWGPAINAAIGQGIQVTGWKASHLSWHFYMRHVDDPRRIDLKKLSPEGWQDLRSRPLTPAQEDRLNRFFADRYQKGVSFDMKSVKMFRQDVSELKARYAPGDKPVWAVFAHINWDSVSDFAPMAYPSFDDWMLDTLRHIVEIPDVQWLIKIHPVEAWDNPATGVQRLIERHFPELPDHVKVVPAEDNISSPNLYELIDGGVTVYGTAGLELALLGKPVILAGEAHYGGKGFTYEGHTPAAYRELLKRAPGIGPLPPEQRIDVRKYAYSHFIRRQIPLEIVHDPNSLWWAFQVDKCELLLPGKDPFIDFVCERLLDGRDFSMDESLIARSPQGGTAA